GAGSYPHPDRRRPQPCKSSRAAHGTTAEADAAAAEGSATAASRRGHPQGISEELQRWRGHDFEAGNLATRGNSKEITLFPGLASLCTYRGQVNSQCTDQRVSPGSLQDYAQWVQLVAALLRGGFTKKEVGKIVGGNYRRIFHAAIG